MIKERSSVILGRAKRDPRTQRGPLGIRSPWTLGSSPRMTGARQTESGFTLLEMLVAVAILAALVGIVPRTLATARSLVDRSQDWVEARLVADHVLNDELSGASLRPGTRRGTVDGRRWRAVLQRDLDIPDQTPETGRVLLAVTVEVAVNGAQTFEVETMRIGLPE